MNTLNSAPANIQEGEGDFFVYLTIDGTSYEDVLLNINEPATSIRQVTERIVQTFELPRLDNGGNPIPYLLGITIEEDQEPEILEFEDGDGREQSILDYNVQPGAHLHLFSAPIGGGGGFQIAEADVNGISPDIVSGERSEELVDGCAMPDDRSTDTLPYTYEPQIDEPRRPVNADGNVCGAVCGPQFPLTSILGNIINSSFGFRKLAT